MLNIYVLEDHFIQQNRIEEVIHTVLKKNNIKVGDFEVFDKPNQLLESITERGSHQLFFLDIQIKDDTKKVWKWLSRFARMIPMPILFSSRPIQSIFP